MNDLRRLAVEQQWRQQAEAEENIKARNVLDVIKRNNEAFAKEQKLSRLQRRRLYVESLRKLGGYLVFFGAVGFCIFAARGDLQPMMGSALAAIIGGLLLD